LDRHEEIMKGDVMKKGILVAMILMVYDVSSAGMVATPERPMWMVSLSGMVQRPLNLSPEDLDVFRQVTVRSSGEAIVYQGIPLKSLMEFVHIRKEGSPFPETIDLGILIRSRNGNKVLLSWGEVFEQDPSDVVLTLSKSDTQTGTLESESVETEFPRLIMIHDQDPERWLKGVVNIEAVEVASPAPKVKEVTKTSPAFTIVQKGLAPLRVEDLTAYPYGEVSIQVPSGEEISTYSGAYLADLLASLGLKGNLNTMLILMSESGRQCAVSYGELTLSAHGQRILIADRIDGETIKDTGRFHIVFPNDRSGDRRIEALKCIDVVQVKQEPRIYVIGMGCGDTRLLTLEALSYIYKTDAFVCNDDIGTRFRDYMGNKPVLFNPMMQVSWFYRRIYPDTPLKEAEAIVAKIYDDNIQQIRAQLKAGKTIALLEPGDPTVYGGWTNWLPQHFEKDLIQVVAGISSFNVGNALLGRNVTEGSVLITEPKDLLGSEDLIRAVAEGGDTMVIFMGLKDLTKLVPLFLKYYRHDTPTHLVYNAGQNYQEKRISTTLDRAVDAAEQESDRFLGLIYIGWDLELGR
jgi:precorrin-4 methylase